MRTSLSVGFGLDFANDDVGFANRQQVEFEAEAFAIFIGPGDVVHHRGAEDIGSYFPSPVHEVTGF